MDLGYHRLNFRYLATSLSGNADTCILELIKANSAFTLVFDFIKNNVTIGYCVPALQVKIAIFAQLLELPAVKHVVSNAINPVAKSHK